MLLFDRNQVRSVASVNRVRIKACLTRRGQTFFEPPADHGGSVRVCAYRDQPAAQFAVHPEQRQIGQRGIHGLEQTRNIDFQRFLILYQNFKYVFYLPGIRRQIWIYARSLHNVAQRISKVSKTVKIRKSRSFGKLVKVALRSGLLRRSPQVRALSPPGTFHRPCFPRQRN